LNADEQRYLLALKRRKAALLAKDDMLSFAKLMMPRQDDHENPDKSEYQVAKHHRVIAAALEEVEKGKIKRLIVNLGPRHGKSQLTSRLFPTWYLGRNPRNSVILATYNESMSWDFGRDCRALINDPVYSQIFPDVKLKAGSASVDRLETEQGGKLFLAGVGGSLTGRGSSIILVDDPIKSREDADSPTKREKLWSWYNQVLKTRLMTATGAIIIIQTRWHEDDLVGRITDPMNACYSAAEAKKWRLIDLPALAKENDVLGRKVGEALWPERFPVTYLHELREADGRGFQALYQGSPTPEKGNFFSADKMRVYTRPTDRPPNSELRFYCASDHAVSTKQDRDKTCLVTVGIDADDNIWLIDNIEWGRWETDVVVEKMINIMEQYKPLMWFAERGHISKSIGPFLRKRMLERNTFCAIDEIVPVQDKQTRAQSLRGRIAMGKVYFPSYATWYPELYDQILKFPFGANDDAVDSLAYIGLGLALQVRARPQKAAERGPAPYTLGWIKKQSRDAERDRRARNGGW